MTTLGIEVALNLAVVTLLIDAYFRPPRGWTGGPLAQLFCNTVFCGAIVLLMVNFSYWLELMWRSRG